MNNIKHIQQLIVYAIVNSRFNRLKIFVLAFVSKEVLPKSKGIVKIDMSSLCLYVVQYLT